MIVDYDGVVGTYQGFDAKGDVVPQWDWLVRYQNGEWVEGEEFRGLFATALQEVGGVEPNRPAGAGNARPAPGYTIIAPCRS